MDKYSIINQSKWLLLLSFLNVSEKYLVKDGIFDGKATLIFFFFFKKSISAIETFYAHSQEHSQNAFIEILFKYQHLKNIKLHLLKLAHS